MTVALIVLLCASAIANILSRPENQQDARDVWLKAATYCAGVWLTWQEPGLGLLFLGAAWRYKSHEANAEVLLLGLVAAVYLVARGLSPIDSRRVILAFVTLATLEVACAAYQALACWAYKFSMHKGRDRIYATLGNRQHLGAWCALALPLVPTPWLIPVFAFGLALSTSWTALGAAFLGACWRWPRAAPGLLAGALLVGCATWLYRGHPRDSWTERRLIWRLMGETWLCGTWYEKVFGFGRYSLRDEFGVWWAEKGYLTTWLQQAHNDLAHITFERGVYGGVAALLWTGSVFMHGHLGDGLTASMVALCGLSLLQFPFFIPQVATVVVILAGLLAGHP